MYLGTIFNYPSKTLSLATKVVVNQIVFTPVFNSYFFGMQSLLSGDSFADAWDRIKRTVPASFINSCKVWPAVTLLQFYICSASVQGPVRRGCGCRLANLLVLVEL